MTPILLGGLLVVSALLHLQAVQMSSGVAFDIESYTLQAATIFHRQNVYVVTDRYPYPPVWICIVACLQWLAVRVPLPFDQLVKLPAVIGDLGTIVLLYVYARQRVGQRFLALIPAALFALNPVAILISAGHGQFDALVLLFILLALVIRGTDADQRPVAAGLALGVAIALKGYPVLLLPYFALSAPSRQRVKTIVAPIAPLVVSVGMYSAVFGFSAKMVTQVLGYRSTPDGGWGLILHTWAGLSTSSLDPIASALHIFLLVFAVAASYLVNHQSQATAASLIFAVFHATTVNLSVQYVLWLLPFLCLAWPLGAVIYTLPALIVPLGLYVSYFPGAVPMVPVWQVVASLLAPLRVWGAAGVIVASAIVALQCLVRRTTQWENRRAIGTILGERVQ